MPGRIARGCIGSNQWPGLLKVVEEAGEVAQVLMKLLAVEGEQVHFDGSDLHERIAEEVGDLRAALGFFEDHNSDRIDSDAVRVRTVTKRDRFEEWHRDANPWLPRPPADRKHHHSAGPTDLGGNRRCILCGAYRGSVEDEGPCVGMYAESGKMRSWARREWEAGKTPREGYPYPQVQTED